MWKQILKVAVALMLVALVWKLVAGDETTETGVDE
jgi:hypothetical protein